jgi:hypothetical protein
MILILIAVVFLLTQIADVVTTILAVRAGASEGNPIIKVMIKKLGLIPALLLIKFLVLISIGLGIYYLPTRWIMIILVMASVVYTAVCINNFLVFRKQR